MTRSEQNDLRRRTLGNFPMTVVRYIFATLWGGRGVCRLGQGRGGGVVVTKAL